MSLLGIRDRRRNGSPHIPPQCFYRFSLICEVAVQVKGASNVSWLVTHSVSLPDLIRPSPCTGLLYTPFSVSLCAASVPLNRTSLHSPTQAQEAEKYLTSLCTPSRKVQAAGKPLSFLFRFVHKFVYNVLMLVLVHQLVCSVRSLLGLVQTHRIQDAIARRGLQ